LLVRIRFAQVDEANKRPSIRRDVLQVGKRRLVGVGWDRDTLRRTDFLERFGDRFFWFCRLLQSRSSVVQDFQRVGIAGYLLQRIPSRDRSRGEVSLRHRFAGRDDLFAVGRCRFGGRLGRSCRLRLLGEQKRRENQSCVHGHKVAANTVSVKRMRLLR
jgi:hypothetical protein